MLMAASLANAVRGDGMVLIHYHRLFLTQLSRSMGTS
jgi:hypothetical protein